MLAIFLPKFASERADMLARIQTNRRLVALPLAQVRILDRQLAGAWGADFAEGDLETRLSRVPDRAAAVRYVLAHNAAHENLRHGGSSLTAEAELFDAMAHPELLGLVTSQRRHLLLDGIAAAIGLARYLGLDRDILDIGCHAGIATSLLAGFLDRPVVGIDPSAAAIASGQAHPSRHEQVELIKAQIPWETERRFDLALSLDAMPQLSATAGPYLRNVGHLLNPGGVALIASSYWASADVALTRRQLHAGRLGFGYSDVLGGFGGTPPEFSATVFLLLVKGTDRRLPRGFLSLASADWSGFAKYANDPAVPHREKTQAFYRAR
jgi:SAM-dependent methyltransferase